MKFILILLLTISSTFAYVNGPCSDGNGICIDSYTCSSFGGTAYSGKCPSDPYNVKCCDSISCSANGKTGTCMFASQCSGESVGGYCPGGSDFKCCLSGGSSSGTYFGPCSGGGGACINADTVSCETSTVSGRCPGANNIKCCQAGSRPSWYINQNEHTKPICTIGGVNKSVASSGCGIASLTMGISVTLGRNLAPEDLFKEGYDNGYYNGNGFSHEAISFLGRRHGVQVSWTGSVSSAYSALAAGKGVIFNVGPDSKYHFTSEGHYIFLKGVKDQNGIQKVYVYDPNGRNNYINVLFALKKSDGGIEVAKAGFGDDFGIVSKA